MTTRQRPSKREQTKRPATPTAGRSEAKARARRSYTDAERKAALAMVRGSGLAETHASTGIPKATLSRWAKAAGIDLEPAARARTRAAAATVEAKAAEVRITTVERLERILELELTALEERSRLEVDTERLVIGSPIRYVPTMGGDKPEPVDQAARDALARLELLAHANPKRDTVGAATRAVHDLALLKGEATERGAIVVRFGIPRPDAAQAEAQAVDEADLAGGNP